MAEEQIDILGSSFEEHFNHMLKVSYGDKEIPVNSHNAMKIAFMAGAKVANAQALMGGTTVIMIGMLELEEFTQRVVTAKASDIKGRL